MSKFVLDLILWQVDDKTLEVGAQRDLTGQPRIVLDRRGGAVRQVVLAILARACPVRPGVIDITVTGRAHH